jgi:hypothetical protein
LTKIAILILPFFFVLTCGIVQDKERIFAVFRDGAAHPSHPNRQHSQTTAQAQKCIISALIDQFLNMYILAYILFFRRFVAFFGRAGFGSTFSLLHQI